MAVEARAAGHARAEVRRDPRHLLARRVGELFPNVAYKASKADDGDVLPSGRDPERRLRRSLQRDPARPDGHADGGRHARSRISGKTRG